MTETGQRTRINGITYIDGHRRIRGITVYDFGERCLPLSSQPSNSAEFLLHTHSSTAYVGHTADRQTNVYISNTPRPPASQLIPGLHLIFGRGRDALGWLNSRPWSMSSIFSIFVIFLHIALKIWHKIFVLLRFSKIWKKDEFSILPIFEIFFLFFAYFAINKKRGRLTQKSFCKSCWKCLTLLLT